MYEKWKNVLKNSKLFAGNDEDAIGDMLKCLAPHVVAYKKNENIAIAGEELKGVGIILKGEAAVVQENFEGSRIILTILEIGDTFGEMGAFSRERVWPATVIAQENAEIMFIEPQNIIFTCGNTCTGHRSLMENFIRTITEKALMLNRKVEYLGIKSIRARLCKFLLENYKRAGNLTFMLPLKRNELADFLNITRPSLSREMCRMRDEGLIDFHMSSIKILELEVVKNYLR